MANSAESCVGLVRVPLITPNVDQCFLATRRVFPFCLARQTSTAPLRIGFGFVPRNAHAWLLGINKIWDVSWPRCLICIAPTQSVRRPILIVCVAARIDKFLE